MICYMESFGERYAFYFRYSLASAKQRLAQGRGVEREKVGGFHPLAVLNRDAAVSPPHQSRRQQDLVRRDLVETESGH